MEVNLNSRRDGGESGRICVRQTKLAGALSPFGTFDIFMVGVYCRQIMNGLPYQLLGHSWALSALGAFTPHQLSAPPANPSDQILLFYYRTLIEHIIASYIIVCPQQSITPRVSQAPSLPSSQHISNANTLSNSAWREFTLARPCSCQDTSF